LGLYGSPFVCNFFATSRRRPVRHVHGRGVPGVSAHGARKSRRKGPDASVSGPFQEQSRLDRRAPGPPESGMERARFRRHVRVSVQHGEFDRGRRAGMENDPEEGNQRFRAEKARCGVSEAFCDGPGSVGHGDDVQRVGHARQHDFGSGRGYSLLYHVFWKSPRGVRAKGCCVDGQDGSSAFYAEIRRPGTQKGNPGPRRDGGKRACPLRERRRCAVFGQAQQIHQRQAHSYQYVGERAEAPVLGS